LQNYAVRLLAVIGYYVDWYLLLNSILPRKEFSANMGQYYVICYWIL